MNRPDRRALRNEAYRNGSGFVALGAWQPGTSKPSPPTCARHAIFRSSRFDPQRFGAGPVGCCRRNFEITRRASEVLMVVGSVVAHTAGEDNFASCTAPTA